LRGAHTAADAVKPDLALALEAGITGDVFPGRPEETQAKLGAGPGMFVYNSSELPNRRLVTFVKAAAEKLRIPLQLDLVQGYGDDSAEIQKSNGGVPTVCLVVPVRYAHAHNGIMNRQWICRSGERGIDIRFRLGLYRALKQSGLTESELKDAALRALPLKLGEQFSMTGGIITIIGGLLFIVLASESTRDLVLQIHRVFGGPFDFQWLALYVGVSISAFVLTAIIAVGVYSSRTWKFF
jgi:hypothetical protein